LSTAGGLVFQGDSGSKFAAYDAASGAPLWSTPVQTGVVAAPMTYSINGEQYVAVLAGWGGIMSMAPGILAEAGGPVRNISRLLVFKLHGAAALPPEPPLSRLPLDPPAFKGKAEQVVQGAKSYGRSCGMCHGDAAYGSTVVPDLRRSGLLNDAKSFAAVVHDGLLKDKGMVGFGSVLSPEQVENIRQYIIKRANEDKQLGVK
jgi:alcohol dehydrogenase (cytochrome c)/quinohemoprotein ethanol dehydrogenase